MDPANEQKARDWIDRHQPVCPVCRGTAWAAGDLIGPPIMETPITGLQVNRVGVGFLVQILCGGCSLVLHVNAMDVGVVPRLPPL
jgi:hypothetical protein